MQLSDEAWYWYIAEFARKEDAERLFKAACEENLVVFMFCSKDWPPSRYWVAIYGTDNTIAAAKQRAAPLNIVDSYMGKQRVLELLHLALLCKGYREGLTIDDAIDIIMALRDFATPDEIRLELVRAIADILKRCDVEEILRFIAEQQQIVKEEREKLEKFLALDELADKC